MGKRHFFLYDFLLPLAGILAIGRFLADRFDTALFRSVDSVRAFGLGYAFAHSDLRLTLWRYSWLVFALIPAAAWMVWVRINLEYDFLERRRRLDRPVFKFFQALARWIEGGDEVKRVRLELEGRLARAHDQIHRLEAELSAARVRSREEWPEDVMPPAVKAEAARRQG